MDASATTPIAAFAVGLVTSLHCAGMCGPLTCAMFGSCGKRMSLSAAASYQCTRVLMYTALGGLLGAVGGSAGGFFGGGTAKLVPWGFAIVFVMLAFGLESRIAPPAFLSRFFAGSSGGMPAILRWKRALPFVLGAATPLIPCGPLYLMLGIALVAGSFFDGAKLMLAFAMGTLPLYAAAQFGWARYSARLSPRNLQWTRRGFALVSTVLLLWRANAGTTISNAVCALCR